MNIPAVNAELFVEIPDDMVFGSQGGFYFSDIGDSIDNSSAWGVLCI